MAALERPSFLAITDGGKIPWCLAKYVCSVFDQRLREPLLLTPNLAARSLIELADRAIFSDKFALVKLE